MLPLNIVSVDGLPESAQVGDEVTVRVLWQATDTLSEDYHFFIVWINQNTDDDQAAAEAVSLVTGYPPDTWQAGDTWRGTHTLYVPGRLAGGVYDVALQVIDPPGQPAANVRVIDTMEVSTPERVYTLPDSAQPLDTRWQNGITLRGYEVTDDSAGILFYWTTQEPLQQNLRYFVHALDSSDNHTILAQSDGVPGNWQRPVTGWDTGEIITTRHLFNDLPNGRYPLRVGWYHPQTGERVPLASGGDVFNLSVSLQVTR
jgi:hypothetical protein